jgi:ribosome-interacting GTPase 1
LLKTTKKKIEEEVYKTPIEKATSLLNLRTKGTLAKKEESLL